MTRQLRQRLRTEQPQIIVEPALGNGLRTTFFHTPAMGGYESARAASRIAKGNGISTGSMSGELAHRFTGAHGSTGLNWGRTPVALGSTAFLAVVRFRLTSFAGSPKVFAKWGPGSPLFLIQFNIDGELIFGVKNGTNSQGQVFLSNYSTSLNVTQTIAICAQSSVPLVDYLSFSVDGKKYGNGQVLDNNGASTGFFDAPNDLQIGCADDGGPMSGFVSLAAIAVGKSGTISNILLNSITLNPWQLAQNEGIYRVKPAAVTIYRPGSDIITNGWTGTPNASLFQNINEDVLDRSSFISSPNMSSPVTFGWGNGPLPIGSHDAVVDFDSTAGTGRLRLVALDAGGAIVGTSSWQNASAVATSYTFSGITLSADSTSFRIEIEP